MALAFTLLFVLLHLVAMRTEILRRRVRALQQTPVERAALVRLKLKPCPISARTRSSSSRPMA